MKISSNAAFAVIETRSPGKLRKIRKSAKCHEMNKSARSSAANAVRVDSPRTTKNSRKLRNTGLARIAHFAKISRCVAFSRLAFAGPCRASQRESLRDVAKWQAEKPGNASAARSARAPVHNGASFSRHFGTFPTYLHNPRDVFHPGIILHTPLGEKHGGPLAMAPCHSFPIFRQGRAYWGARENCEFAEKAGGEMAGKALSRKWIITACGNGKKFCP